MLVDDVPLQDRDLLARLTQYFATLDVRLREGQGWLIFNAGRQRAARISRFILDRLAEQRPFVSYYHVPWRDFALNAYMVHVELPAHGPATVAVPETPRQREYYMAGRVSTDQVFNMKYSDVLVVATVRPDQAHQATHLAQVVEERASTRRATILVVPGSPSETAAAFRALGAASSWDAIYDRMYRTSLLAL